MKFKIIMSIVFVLMFFALRVVLNENKMLREQNQMLENTIENFGQEIEELSTQIDDLMKDLNRGNNWNEEAIPEYRR